MVFDLALDGARAWWLTAGTTDVHEAGVVCIDDGVIFPVILALGSLPSNFGFNSTPDDGSITVIFPFLTDEAYLLVVWGPFLVLSLTIQVAIVPRYATALVCYSDCLIPPDFRPRSKQSLVFCDKTGASYLFTPTSFSGQKNKKNPIHHQLPNLSPTGDGNGATAVKKKSKESHYKRK